MSATDKKGDASEALIPPLSPRPDAMGVTPVMAARTNKTEPEDCPCCAAWVQARGEEDMTIPLKWAVGDRCVTLVSKTKMIGRIEEIRGAIADAPLHACKVYRTTIDSEKR